MANTIKIDGKDWRVVETGGSVGWPVVRADWLKGNYDPDSVMQVEHDAGYLPFPIKREARLHIKTGEISIVP